MQKNGESGVLPKINTRSICYCAVLVALLVVTSQLTLPIPFSPVPMSLAVLGIMLCGIFGPTMATASVAAYILLGAVGMPVFANFRGAEALVSAGGGYIIGYIPAAFVFGCAFKYLKNPIAVLFALFGGVALCYLCGTVYYSLYATVSVKDALLLCVVPFIPLDIIKGIAATVAGMKIKKALRKFI